MRKFAWRRVALAAVVLLAGPTIAAQDEAKPAASASRAGARLDVEYGFAVQRDGKDAQTSVLTDVRSGDRFHVRVRPKQTAYAYLFVSKDAKAYDIVLPSERSKASDAMLSRNEWNTLPDQDWLRFDGTRGIERLYLVIASGKIDEIEDLFEKTKTPDAVDETWLLDLRTKLEGEGTTNRDRSARTVSVSHRRRGPGPAAILEMFTIRHK